MTDVVVTVPKGLWTEWLEEGDLAGEPWSEEAEYHFWIPRQPLPKIEPGERVYIVAHGKVRGYAPLVRIERSCRLAPNRACLVRRGGAVAVTWACHNGPGWEPVTVRGFQGWRYRWWSVNAEQPFDAWREP